MTDRELLELAAKAAGLDDARWQDGIWSEKLWEVIGEGYWNPLEDDADAFRLMVDLKMCTDTAWGHAFASCSGGIPVAIPQLDDPFATTRRAIVTVAAEIGRGMG